VASLEFAVPPSPLWRALWSVYVRVVLPALGRLVSREWQDTGTFLARSIPEFYSRHPLDEVVRFWTDSGIGSVDVRRMSLGGGVVIWGTREGGRAEST
jgi:demethylmenaquinone methyltransferase/2-methoxy-6-polyprenyl-1,4-benzoquinol methylase